MSNQLSPATRDRFLTVRWNNVLAGALGVPALLFASFALLTDGLSDRSAFIGLVIFGAVY